MNGECENLGTGIGFLTIIQHLELPSFMNLLDANTEGVDRFFYKLMYYGENYILSLKIVKIVMFHMDRQASVESGFSIRRLQHTRENVGTPTFRL